MRQNQNFLTNHGLIGRLVDQADLTDSAFILDIGAGYGNLTVALSRIANRVIAVEIDPNLSKKLEDRLNQADVSHVNVLNADVTELKPFKEKFKTFSNIPFDLTAEIMHWLFEANAKSFLGGYLILEKAAALKFLPYSTSNMLGIIYGFKYDLDFFHEFRREDFSPKPSVNTVMIEIKIKEGVSVKDYMLFKDLITYIFKYSQKDIGSGLKKVFTNNQLNIISKKLDIDMQSNLREIPHTKYYELFETFKLHTDISKKDIVAGSWRDYLNDREDSGW